MGILKVAAIGAMLALALLLAACGSETTGDAERTTTVPGTVTKPTATAIRPTATGPTSTAQDAAAASDVATATVPTTETETKPATVPTTSTATVTVPATTTATVTVTETTTAAVAETTPTTAPSTTSTTTTTPAGVKAAGAVGVTKVATSGNGDDDSDVETWGWVLIGLAIVAAIVGGIAYGRHGRSRQSSGGPPAAPPAG